MNQLHPDKIVVVISVDGGVPEAVCTTHRDAWVVILNRDVEDLEDHAILLDEHGDGHTVSYEVPEHDPARSAELFFSGLNAEETDEVNAKWATRATGTLPGVTQHRLTCDSHGLALAVPVELKSEARNGGLLLTVQDAQGQEAASVLLEVDHLSGRLTLRAWDAEHGTDEDPFLNEALGMA